MLKLFHARSLVSAKGHSRRACRARLEKLRNPQDLTSAKSPLLSSPLLTLAIKSLNGFHPRYKARAARPTSAARHDDSRIAWWITTSAGAWQRAKFLLVLSMLAVSYPAFSQPSFSGNWESVTGDGASHWMRKQVADDNRISLIKDSRRSTTCARVEVKGGDNPESTTQRSEVLMMQDAANNPVLEDLNSGTQQYKFSVKFDRTWQPISGWGIFLQLHGDDIYSTNPALAFTATDKIRLHMRTGDITQEKGGVHDLDDGDLNEGQWIDFILTVKFAKDDTGFVTVMRRNEGQADFTQVLNLQNRPTLLFSSNVQNGKVLGHYWKYGLYRNRENFNSILYLDGLTRETVNRPDTPPPRPPLQLITLPKT